MKLFLIAAVVALSACSPSAPATMAEARNEYNSALAAYDNAQKNATDAPTIEHARQAYEKTRAAYKKKYQELRYVTINGQVYDHKDAIENGVHYGGLWP